MLDGNSLGAYLRNRRNRLDPGSLGIGGGRRRTTGLRREEVAQRANISATWYTWLEQGRGGSPSADVLDRIGRALMLTAVEREHLFLVGLGRPPEVRYHAPDTITPRLQRLLDALTHSPAVVRTARWDVVAWNRAAALVLTDYGLLPPDQRNILRMIFSNAPIGSGEADWESLARFAVASFRIDAARAGADAEIAPLVAELCHASPAFASMWHDHDVRAPGDDVKHLHHPRIGSIALEYSAFAVDARPDLSLIVFNPATSADQDLIRSLIEDAR